MPNTQNTQTGSRLPKLPTLPDRTGKNAEVVDGSHLVTPMLVAMGLAIAAAIAAFPMKSPAVGLAILGIDIVGVLVLLGMGAVTARSFFCRSGRPASEARRAHADDDADARMACLGGLLGDPRNASMAVACDRLTPEEVSNFRANRAEESDTTWEWLCGCPDYETLRCQSYDGLKLVGHVLRCNPDSRRWMVFFHGWNGDWLEGMLYARHYAQQGYNLLFVEQRAHGNSEGRWIAMGWRERFDVVSWVQALVASEGEDIAVVLHGHSMGGATVVAAADLEDLPSQVKAIVADAAYTDVWNVMLPILKAEGTPCHPTLDMASLVFRNLKGGVNLLSVYPITAAKHARVPLLFMHGDKDVFVPPYMALDFDAEAGDAAAGEHHLFVNFPHAGHVQSSLSDPARYYDSLFGFVTPFVDGTAAPLPDPETAEKDGEVAPPTEEPADAAAADADTDEPADTTTEPNPTEEA